MFGSLGERFVDRFGPYGVATPVLMIIFGLYGTFLPFGPLGSLGFAIIGYFWSLLVGTIVGRLMSRQSLRGALADVPLLLSIVATGLLMGGGFMYTSMMGAALEQASTTYAVLSALMGPAVPYYIVINSSMELLIVPSMVFSNWNTDKKRRMYIIAEFSFT